jgi:heme oxygenase (biliverdin-IX-beta and delta-forming)
VNEEEIEDDRRRPPVPDKAGMATQARAMLRSRRTGALATALATDAGWPYASLVTFACDVDGSPILLLSGLSDHTRNLDRDPRGSLLVENASGRANPQTGPRLSLLGRVAPDGEPRLRRRFLARHPGAALYAGFMDFRVFRMTVERGHWVGGFGQARWLQASDVLADSNAAAAIASEEPSTLDQINSDQEEAIDRCATGLLGRAGSGWRIVAIDPDGCDLARGNSFARLPFARAARDTGEVRAMLIELASKERGGGALARTFGPA